MPADVSSVRASHHTGSAPVRGHACTVCRRRKLVGINIHVCAFNRLTRSIMLQKCDGDKPKCKQCVRAGRGTECHYDDSRPTNTQILQEKIRQLERVVQSYEKSIATQQHQAEPSPTTTILVSSNPTRPVTPVPTRTVTTGATLSPNMAYSANHSGRYHQDTSSSNTSDQSSGSDIRLGIHRSSSGGGSSYTVSSAESSYGVSLGLNDSLQKSSLLVPGPTPWPLTSSPGSFHRGLPDDSLLFPSPNPEQEWDTEELPAGKEQRMMWASSPFRPPPRLLEYLSFVPSG